ncbi:3-methylcrotonyl-CoA carboxylase alpha subunit [Tamilnaduibacter salinus]|uniref:Biotin carboxylase n=1 Tax=Tamilnaduibacter salinus TaxID=1484056 RepID=A0A2A2I0R2_9GAMM|nr:biotin carboxylase N-terminal domain-containing protein [Tamilnaduibacter salinus]PAV25611.1 3-methylcrotonyl-CoA carboxylase [Tamilnaduibacter salinus]PVY78096.1 3-methylcrotonyl-CoA carboxylase alpha subunit [Tamilnaduibacter salinus]
MTETPIRTLLVANRGEIAHRIMRTARRMGVHTVAVFSDPDHDAPFVLAADEAVRIGPAEASQSYLNVDAIIKAARDTGADAIHPGYGFLSENTDLAAACANHGIHFIGPPASAIRAMGSKSAAKALVAEADVPLVPGYHGDEQSDERLRAEADNTGYPLLIKASAGGGGKGMRVVRGPDELDEAIASARREAESGFGDPHLLLERYLENPRHVEVQVLFDRHGAGRYLFDRDCSVQRRHQKIIEEAPAPGLSDSVRQAMGEAAIRCGVAIGYTGAGTVEFLYEPGGHFYFMEMNTRLQVEHPVTEMITGLDLVEWQLRVAANEPLPWAQADLSRDGHAMEARVYAEDPDNGFLPATGTLYRLQEPQETDWLRVDSGVAEGLSITPWYDPMLAKVIAWGPDRETARRRLSDALIRYRAQGVTLNTGFVHRVLSHSAFARADLTTHFIEQYEDSLHATPFTDDEQQALTWLAWYQRTAATPDADPWSFADAFRLGGPREQPCELSIGQTDRRLNYELQAPGRAVLHLDADRPVQTIRWRPGANADETIVSLGGRDVVLASCAHGEQLGVFANANHWTALVNHPEEQKESDGQDNALHAPMHGRITDVPGTANVWVEAGTALVVMEAMKMEHTLRAPANGTVAAIHCGMGDSVGAGQELVAFEPDQETSE